MNQIVFWLLALCISLNSPAMERAADSRQSSFAAKDGSGLGNPFKGKTAAEIDEVQS
jgi:hypothetical protein